MVSGNPWGIPMRLIKALIIACLLLIAGFGIYLKNGSEELLPFYVDGDLTPQWIVAGTAGYGGIHKVAPFRLTNQHAEMVTQETFNGKIYVADFFFATCPGICSSMTQNMLKIQEAFKDDADVLFLSHSVTPEIDTVPVLNRYAEEYGIMKDKWHLVTGPRKDIYTLARQSYFAEEDLGLPVEEDDFLHTELFFLIDIHGRIRGIYKGTFPNEMTRLIEDIRILKQEGDMLAAW